MGHITYISDEIAKLLSIADFITYNIEEWSVYIDELRVTKDADSKVLGGARPDGEYGVNGPPNMHYGEDFEPIPGGILLFHVIPTFSNHVAYTYRQEWSRSTRL
jgi:hypothetical protein